jgi:hypothetical protein
MQPTEAASTPFPTYQTGQRVNLFDAVLAQLGEGSEATVHPGCVIGLVDPTRMATIALIGAKYCESDGRQEVTDLGNSSQFFRADGGIVCLVAKATRVPIEKLSLVAVQAGLPTSKLGVVDEPQMAICRPDPLMPAHSPLFPVAGGQVVQH